MNKFDSSFGSYDICLDNILENNISLFSDELQDIVSDVRREISINTYQLYVAVQLLTFKYNVEDPLAYAV